MKPQLLHEATASFVLWLDNYILTKGQAYTNYTDQQLYYVEDEKLGVNNIRGYSSAFKQWVSDTSIPGANVPNSVQIFTNGVANTNYRNNNGMMIDFKNGRVLFDGYNSNGQLVIDTNEEITASFAVKDFNIYVTDQDEEDLITESKYDINHRFSNTEIPIPPYKPVLPAIFVSCKKFENEEFAFGGEISSALDFRCVIMSDDMYKLDGAISILSDAKDANFKEIPYPEYPESEYGDYTSLAAGNKWNYQDQVANYTEKYFIDSVTCSKLNDKLQKKILPNQFVGFVDFDVVKYRTR